MEQDRDKPIPNGTRNLTDEDITQAVLDSFGKSHSERFQVVMESLVRHMHDFVKEIQLTEDEWFKAIDYLTRTGHITDDKRQEFILLSDVLGTSMLVIDINNKQYRGATASTVFGPFFFEGSPQFVNGDDIANGAAGEPCYIQGRVLSTTGEPLPNAHIEVWQADDNGFYDVQDKSSSAIWGRGHLSADKDGYYAFWSVKPAAYPIPEDGPVGELLHAANRSPMRPAHVHFMIRVPGYKTLITHIFAKGDKYLDSDAVFGVKSTLIADFERHEPGIAPDGKQMDVPFYSMHYDFLLARSEEKTNSNT